MLTPEQKDFTLAFLADLPKIDAIQCSIRYQNLYGIHIDWHEFAYYLDTLHSQGKLRITKHGFTEYAIVPQTMTLEKYGLRVMLDKTQVFKEDPGRGTPAMVYNKAGASATYTCACNEGELENSRTGNMNYLNDKQLKWLAEIETDIDKFLGW
jgi:hypothetical protein